MAESDPAAAYERVVAAAYDSILCSANWSATLEALMALCGAQCGAFLLADGRQARATMFDTVNMAPAMLDDYNREFGQLDPNLAYKLRHPEVCCLVDRLALDPSQLRHGPFHQEFMRPHGLHTSMALTINAQGSDLIGSFSVHRHLGNEDYGRGDVDWAMRAQPHLARALSLHARFSEVRDAAAAGLAVVDTLSIPLFLLEDDGRVLLMNRAARELAQREAALPLRAGRLAVPPAAARPVSRTVLTRSEGRGALVLLEVRVHAEHALAAHWQRPLRLMLAEEEQRVPHDLAGALVALFGLTAAEARVCVAVASEGLSPAECADLFGVSIHTIRSQLKAILDKTGTRRSADLGRAVGSLQALRVS